MTLVEILEIAVICCTLFIGAVVALIIVMLIILRLSKGVLRGAEGWHKRN